ncbi:PREDICTED: uncharacterized protein LOC108565824 [Nicrophorus vespilloides]|uniref:Uncharacterized protein LOC108565824 n=1 Tax=Nicrophorus vespilloides TaxID=110193 RepID=A0ABM1N2A9_NICVS|nr:PREDICTED: uncharacterized protein LOC108565824 [Nicrophorus vespilloides]
MILVLLFTVFVAASSADLATILKPCNRTSDINACLINNIEVAKSEIINGFPDLSIPPLNNLLITHSTVKIPNLDVDFWNFNITGLENFVIQSIDCDLNKEIIVIKIQFPYGKGVGSYKIKGHIFNLNLDSMGEINGNATNAILLFTMRTKVIEKGRDFYFRRVSQEVKLHLEHGVFYCYMDNLYPGNKILTEKMNEIINANSYYMYEVLVPFVENMFNDILSEAFDLLFEKFTYDQMFP